jgi:hypothetical protein
VEQTLGQQLRGAEVYLDAAERAFRRPREEDPLILALIGVGGLLVLLAKSLESGDASTRTLPIVLPQKPEGLRRDEAAVQVALNSGPMFVDARALAKVLGVSVAAIRKWTRQGMPSQNLGRSRRFQIDQCLAWCKQRAVQK